MAKIWTRITLTTKLTMKLQKIQNKRVEWTTTCLTQSTTWLPVGIVWSTSKGSGKHWHIYFIAYLGGGGTWDFAIPTHATIPTARIIHPKMSYLKSLLFLFFLETWNTSYREKKRLFNEAITTQIEDLKLYALNILNYQTPSCGWKLLNSNCNLHHSYPSLINHNI